ncbi:short-chain fatty acid transporter [Achromobacter sp. GG226]|uniref:short-chain fatty acid transporter n=1 Tax=Verticiella alkaliphila TaxID=2779529 RepID=UPI001C0AB1F6|nr:TIGR00366 family protein [Verticiella sp. GG226]MBU4612536.1 short-chain fatty acid transporter [Verticiella sp. GG226]
MFKFVTRQSVKLVERYLPDPYIFVALLTFIAAAAAMLIEGQAPVEVLRAWGGGFWGLMVFTLQMVMVLLTGYMLASTPPVKALLRRLAGLVSSAGGAILLVTYVSLMASWINWGFGLVVGALFAKELARQVRVDYRLLVASAYSGFLVWHGGLAGSVPLAIATEGHFAQAQIGLVSTADTIFSTFNLLLVAALFVVVPLVNRLMLPDEKDSIYVDRAKLTEAEPTKIDATRPADRLEDAKLIGWLLGAAGLAYMFDYYVVQGGALNLNIINFSFLFLAILLHGSPRRFLDSLNEGIRGAAGIVIQFPFYAGIAAIMTSSGLVASFSNAIVSIASAETLPFWTFLSAGVVNMFIPSGGGQWAVQGPIVIAAAEALNTDVARAVMGVAWGDAWTNMLQPFWALPVLAIAGLKAKDIMGFCLIQLFVSGVMIAVGLTWF